MEKLEDRRVLATWATDITTDTTWTNDEVQHVVADIAVLPGVTLTIEPGTMVQFSGLGLNVQGTLHADGTETEPILFTSDRDDTGFDGILGTADDVDTTGNGPEGPFQGAWRNIEFTAASTGNILDHVEIRAGGSDFVGQLVVSGGELTLSNSRLRIGNAGMRITDSQPVVSDTSFEDHRFQAISMDLASEPVLSDLGFSANGTNALLVDAGELPGDVSWSNPGIEYVTAGEISVPAGSTLTIGPGQMVKSSGPGFIVHGTLQAVGTAGAPILFTSVRDDSGFDGVLGTADDFNTSGNSFEGPFRGAWENIEFTDTSTGSILDHVEVRAGDSLFEGQLVVSNAELTLANSLIRTGNVGLRINNSNPTVLNTHFGDHRFQAIGMDLASDPEIINVTSVGNGTNGLLLDAGVLPGDSSWDDPDIVYVPSGAITVPLGATLTIEAGQMVQFIDQGITVEGTLLATGAAARPILLTSVRDDTGFDGVLGTEDDVNTTSNAAEGPFRGAWQNIEFTPTSTGSILNYVEIRAGDSVFEGQLVVDGGELTLANSWIRTGNQGLRIINSNPTVTNTRFEDHRFNAIYMDLASNPSINGVTSVGNGVNGLAVDGGTLVGDAIWDDPDIVYVPVDDIVVPLGSTLTIGEGQIIKPLVGDLTIAVDGRLLANGAVEAPVIVTSYWDDSAGGDTNGDSSATGPAPGHWGRILLRPGSTGNVINHADLRYGGSFFDGTLIIDDAPLDFTNSVLQKSASDGVVATNSATVTLNSNLIVNNGDAGLEAASTSQVLAVNNTIDGNSRGVVSTGAGTNVELVNNLVSFQTAVGVASESGGTVSLSFNDVFNPGSLNFSGLDDPTGSNGNVSADPVYVDSASDNYGLDEGSPAIDAADGNAAPATDFADNVRVDDPAIANTGTGTPDFVDIGALERDRWFSEIISPIRSGEIIVGDSLRLLAEGDASPGPPRFAWDFGDGRGSDIEDPGVVPFPQAGTQLLTFAVIAADGTPDPVADTREINVVTDGAPLADLDVMEIALPNGLVLGRSFELEYTIRNIGDAAFPALSRVDALYLSSDQYLDSADQLLATRTIDELVGVGDTYAGTFDVVISEELLESGINYLIVSADDQWDVLERRQLNNEEALSFTAAIPSLESGVAMDSAFVDSDIGHFYQIDVPAGSSLSVVLDDVNDQGVTELYASYGTPPTRSQFDARFSNVGADQQLVVPAATPGIWFILAYGNWVPDGGEYTIEATTGRVLLLSTTPDRHGDAIDAVLTIRGAGFGAGTSLELVSGGSVFVPTDFSVDSFTQITATIGAGSIPADTYDVRVTRNGSSDVLENAFTVVSGGEAVLETNLILPGFLGYHQLGTILVEYANTGDVAMPSPLLILQPTQTHADGTTDAKAFLTLDNSNLLRGFWTSSVPDGFASAITFLAHGETPGLLQPGETGRVPVYWAGWQAPFDLSYPPFDFGLRALTSDATIPIDWDSFQQSVPTPPMDSVAYDVVFDNAEASTGTTWGDFIRMLNDNAAYLGRLGQSVNDIAELWAFEMMQAAGVSVEREVARAVDAQVASPGLPLEITRSFGNTIGERYELGPFGRGWAWSDGWLTRLTVNDNDIVTIAGPGGLGRQFEPDVRGGAFFATAGDTGTLTTISGGGHRLTELDGVTTVFTPDGFVEYVEEHNGNRITAGYTNNLPTSLTHSAGPALQIEWNAAGRIMSVTDDAGRATTYTYDAANEHLMSVETFDGQITTYDYSQGSGAASEHALTSVTQGSLRQEFEYDTAGRLTREGFEGGLHVIRYEYGSAGDVTLTTDDDAVSRVLFDHRGLMARIEDGLGRAVRPVYDRNFNAEALIDSAGQRYSFDHDGLGNVVQAVDPLGQTIGYDRGPGGLLDAITDSRGNSIRLTYDANGNTTTTTFPDGTFTSATLNSEGQTMTATNRRGQTSTYAYDGSGRITTRNYSDGSQVDFTYDARGNMTSMTDSTGTTTWTYDGDDRLTQVEYPGGQTLAYTFDAQGRRASVEDQAGFVTNYSYDTADRLTSLTDGTGGTIVTYTYNSLGQLTNRTNGNGSSTSYTYDLGGQLTQLVNQDAASQVVSRYGYSYDILGRRTSTDTLDGLWTYTYDSIGQLTRAVFDSDNPAQIPDQDLTYEYDAAGNRVRTIINGNTTNYTTSDLNQYTSAGTITYVYDADGNLTSKTDGGVTTTYTYDEENQLLEVSTPTDTWTYTYDGLGNRVAMTHNGQTTNFVIDPLESDDVFAEYDGAGNPLRRFVHGLGQGLVGRFDVSGDDAFFHHDGVGNTVSLTDGAGALANSYAYLPYGDVLASSEAIANNYRFGGFFGVTTDGAGQSYMRARYYDSDAGRFTSVDPLGLYGDINFYRYVRNDPISNADPSGLGIDVATAREILRLTAIIERQIGKKAAEQATWALLQRAGTAAPGTVNGLAVNVPRLLTGLRALANNPNLAARLGVTFGAEVATFVPPPATITAPPGTPLTTAGRRILSAGGRVVGVVALGYTVYQISHWSGTQINNHLLSEETRTIIGETLLGVVDDICEVSEFLCGIFGGGTSGNVAAKDPNDKIPIAGFGESNFVRQGFTLPYRINFENDPDATAPAQIVTVTDPLPDQLDPTTLELTEVGFGDVLIEVPPNTQFFETAVEIVATSGTEVEVEIQAGIHPESNELFAQFVTIDPATGLPPDVLTGFLPPEDGTGRGQGFFSFVIDPVPGLGTGMEIRNVAEITFDFGETIATNQVDPHDPSQGTDPAKEALVTIDAGDPTSSVTDLPAAAVTNDFMVDWSGQDDAGGSGVASYDIFVSEDGGAFSPWLLGTTETSGEFTGGIVGRTYGFLSMARDNVGHREPMPTVADTETIVGPWVNPVNVFDVDALDGPTAFDALLIINELGRNTVSDPNTGVLVELPPQGFAPPFYDVAFDGKITALDALRVINELARQSGPGEPVAESLDAVIAAGFPQISHTSRDDADDAALSETGDDKTVPVKLASFGFSSSSKEGAVREVPLAIVDRVSDAVESTLGTLARDVVNQWAVV